LKKKKFYIDRFGFRKTDHFFSDKIPDHLNEKKLETQIKTSHNLILFQHESNFLRWKEIFRPSLMNDLDELRKEYINASLEVFEIPIRNLS
jgi:hypothetical protein